MLVGGRNKEGPIENNYVLHFPSLRFMPFGKLEVPRYRGALCQGVTTGDLFYIGGSTSTEPEKEKLSAAVERFDFL